MPKHSQFVVRLDDQGNCILPADLLARMGWVDGTEIRLSQHADAVSLSRSIDSLAKIYVETTNICNLGCRTCMRNVWDEPAGRMSMTTFERVLEGALDFPARPALFFGGFGEPLEHPGILDMLARARAAGLTVELITNGILLTETVSARLVELGVERVWVSLDGATPEAYLDVRLGDALPLVKANLQKLRELRARACADSPRLGIAFVAMRRNIQQLPEVVRLGRSLGADRFSISNVMAHTPEMREEVLYQRSLYEADGPISEWAPLLGLPRMEMNEWTRDALTALMRERGTLSVARQELALGASTCPFVEKGSLSVCWDGEVSPCLALLHRHTSYLDDTPRQTEAFSVGNVQQRGLLELWADPRYRALRSRLLRFDFSPCAQCNSCEMAESNREDCFGNDLPACGGCLWAQGFIQCP